MPADTDPSVRRRSDHTVIELSGELDIATTMVMRERLLRALRHATKQLIIDLSGVSRCDAPALAVLVGTRRRAKLLGITLRLAAPSPDMAKLLHLTGLDRSLTIHPTLVHALAAATQHPTGPQLRPRDPTASS